MRKLTIAPKIDKTPKSNVTVAAKPKSILHAFENIVELVEDSNLSNDFFEQASQHIKYAARKLRLSPMQVVLLAIFVDRSEDTRIMLSEIARFTGSRTIKMLRMVDDIDVLASRHYIRPSRSRKSVSYRVPDEVLQALRNNKPYEPVIEPVLDTQGFFDQFNRLMKEKKDGEQTHDSLLKHTQDMLDEIRTTAFAKGVGRYDLYNHDMLLFIFMAHLYVENNDDNIRFGDIEDIYDDDEIPMWVKRDLRNHDSELFDKGLIENVNEDGMARSDAFKLTDKAKEELLSELDIHNMGKSDKGLIKADTLTEKTLIYNSTESAQVMELSAILAPDRFRDVQSRLRSAGMRPGFCCIFYGAPGTGKTETVYQLARQSGRDIMRVDVDKIKSCWVGESEKNIKAIFDRYRAICKHSDKAPILLFNEADAVLGVRMEGASRAVDKMENSLQNIILQEMEALDGIMIATTNLTSNLDKAFERRFLYKIGFAKPSVESRAQIWQIMLKGLTAADAFRLAEQFDFSGGEIENIVRKHSVNAILLGNEVVDVKSIADACKLERISGSSRTRIGFHNPFAN